MTEPAGRNDAPTEEANTLRGSARTLFTRAAGNESVDVIANFYNARPTTIYGGSNEIQRNILAMAVLGLPD